MIAITNSYNHHEINMYDNPESEIQFADNAGVLDWVEANIYDGVCTTDSVTTKHNSLNV